MKTKEMKTTTMDAVTVAHDAHETACADLRADQARYRDVEFKLARAQEGAGAAGLDFLVRYRFEAALLELQIGIAEGEHRVREAEFQWASALDADAVAKGEADAVCMATLVEDITALANRSQQGGDVVGLHRAVDGRAMQSNAAGSSLSARRQAAGQPAPLRLDSARVWAVSVELARCATAGVPATAPGIFRAVYGSISALPPAGMSAEDAAAWFTIPQAPKPPTARIQHLRRELDELHGRAYDEYARREAEAAEEARIKREADGARKRAHEREQRAAAATSAEREKVAAAARARKEKVAQFVKTRAAS